MSKKEQKLEFEHATIYQTNENCQVFTGPISGAIFAMPGSTVHQHVGNAEKKAEATEAEVEEEANEGNMVLEEFPVPQALSASRQALSTKLKDLARKGDWQSPASVERMEGLIDALMAEERFCGLLENGRGDRVRIVWQNLVGILQKGDSSHVGRVRLRSIRCSSERVLRTTKISTRAERRLQCPRASRPLCRCWSGCWLSLKPASAKICG